jgi:hypothetical protein
MDLFGWQIVKKDPTEKLDSFAAETHDDGAVVVQEGGSYGTYLDLEGTVKSEAELVTRYREMSLQPEVDAAIDDIVNEMIAYDSDDALVRLNLDKLKLSDPIKNRIRKEFDTILQLYDFNNSAYDICRRWYIDGRMYYHAMIDEKRPEDGIQELRYIDPRRLRKVREVARRRQKTGGVNTVVKTKSEYYVYNERGFAMKETSTTGYTAATGIRIAADTIVHATSGLMDQTNSLVLSYLHKAIKPLNQLRMLEDAAVIYRLSRAPERRIFYIDVGSLPKAKAEQYLRDMMVKHKNKLVYDAATGEVRDDRKFMTMLEDFWLPRREGGRGTEITTLPGGQNLGQMEDVEYFLNKLYKSLNVPASRLQSDSNFNMGRSTEITRDELKFGKFVDRLRLRFSHLLWKTLEKQLVLKRVISQEEAGDIWDKIKFEFAHDNFFTELKETEIMRERMNLLEQVDPFVGKYFSTDWIKTRILRQDEADQKKMKTEMDKDEVAGNVPTQQQGGDGGPEDTAWNSASNAGGSTYAQPGTTGGPDGTPSAQPAAGTSQ